MEWCLLSTFVMWYDKCDKEYTADQGNSSTVRTVTHPDFPAPASYSTLPSTVTLQNGQVMALRRKARVLDWGPKGEQADLMLFKVLSTICLQIAVKYSFRFQHQRGSYHKEQ